ncbi:MAG: IS4 family transposase [Nitrospirae bacterium]|nr:IS4 family transposase [Nitrospirota bacterium]
MAILYSQITLKDSLRDIATGFSAHAARWYHLGLTGIHKSTLSDANANRAYQIFEEVFYHLLSRCKNLTPKHKFRFKNPLYTIDASTIDLCLSVFPWAKFRTTKGAIKLHCLYDYSGALPTFLPITDGKKHDVQVVKDNTFPQLPDSIVSVDKAYIDYKWLNSLDTQGVWFVTRAKTNIDYTIVEQHPISSKEILRDEIISLQGPAESVNDFETVTLAIYCTTFLESPAAMSVKSSTEGVYCESSAISKYDPGAFWRADVSFGGLIQAVVANSGGDGGRLTNLSGWST